ncbi:MAG: hypothetical protein ACK4UN_00965, partial [Limisphaerales bacterium]
QLAALQENWGGIETLGDLQTALRMESAMGTLLFDEIRLQGYLRAVGLTPPNSLIDGLSDFTEEAFNNPREALWAAGNKTVLWPCWKYIWSYDDQIEYSEFYRKTVRLIDAATRDKNLGPLIKEQRIYAENKEDNHGYVDEPDWAIGLARTFYPSMAKLVIRSTTTPTIQQITVTAIALQRYRLKHGGYPQNLENLVPDYLSQLPRDYFDGQTLRYKLQADGNFLLYSVGADLKDDGGEPTPNDRKQQWHHGRDLVWPRAASQPEIEAAEKEKAQTKQAQ